MLWSRKRERTKPTRPVKGRGRAPRLGSAARHSATAAKVNSPDEQRSEKPLSAQWSPGTLRGADRCRSRRTHWMRTPVHHTEAGWRLTSHTSKGRCGRRGGKRDRGIDRRAAVVLVRRGAARGRVNEGQERGREHSPLDGRHELLRRRRRKVAGRASRRSSCATTPRRVQQSYLTAELSGAVEMRVEVHSTERLRADEADADAGEGTEEGACA